LQELDATTKKPVGSKEPPEQIVLDEESEPEVEKARGKIVISIQDKDGKQQIRVYKVIITITHFPRASIPIIHNSTHPNILL
jgi:hypothetical protein